jgi:hypothetical protein
LAAYPQAVRIKSSKKRPLSFERLNMVVMTIMKFFESEIEGEEKSKKNTGEYQKDVLKQLENWIEFVIS